MSDEAEVDPGYIDIMLDMAQRRIARAAEDKRDLDTKSFYILAANGVLLGFLAALWSGINAVAGIISLAFIVMTFFFTSSVIKTREYGVTNVKGAWNQFTPYRYDLTEMKAHIYK